VLDAARQYYLSSYATLRSSSANTLQLIHDAFEPLSYWNGWEHSPQYQGVALDTHIYQMFSNAVSRLSFGHQSIQETRIISMMGILLSSRASRSRNRSTSPLRARKAATCKASTNCG
jgi:hypothetical protein